MIPNCNFYSFWYHFLLKIAPPTSKNALISRKKKYIPKIHPTGEKMSNPYSRQNTLSITIQPLHTFIMIPMMALGNSAHRTSKSDR